MQGQQGEQPSALQDAPSLLGWRRGKTSINFRNLSFDLSERAEIIDQIAKFSKMKYRHESCSSSSITMYRLLPLNPYGTGLLITSSLVYLGSAHHLLLENNKGQNRR